MNELRMGTTGTLKDVIRLGEDMPDWVISLRTPYYLVETAIGPLPFPTIFRV
ncbi:uncharacterized protein MELLADRAFT_94187 [Melampsora larici-populina 98AG31]|uniref:Uncharacterized protein n=1 Tax=Melampsora larici-populina (strain 98AG31 / pathotype 3-4-7) TaxID=747676 RepID=F4S6S8_MELLP|nr:uncharacterized protein MELLADRAFT_94187 [Melampsora larici-populina 98AG31]EGF99622.1 hypothetical protein MELLADRAFT_94187 [Melampsora larici-populina 98AG31]